MTGWRRSAVLATALALPSLAPAQEGSGELELRRMALVIGANDGGPDRVRLRYAGTDAEAMAGVLQELGGVRAGDVMLLRDPTAAEGLEGLDRLAARVEAAQAHDGRLEVVLYYSGHSDHEGILPGGEHVRYADLRERVEALDADVRVSILDSCSSGAIVRTKGGVMQAPFLVDQANAMEGQAYLTSSTADEVSQESDRIGASYFTHHLVAGLRGAADADSDGLVTLSEAYDYTFRETRKSTESTVAGPQNPYSSVELRGHGKLVLTDLRQASSQLVLDDGIGGELWLRRADGRLLVQVDKLPGQALTLSVPPDTYRVVLQARPEPFEARVDVLDDSSTLLAAADFRAASTVLSDDTVRGGTIVRAPAGGTEAEPPDTGEEPADAVAEAPAADEALEVVPFGFQVFPTVGSSGPDKQVKGFAFHIFGGAEGGLHGFGLGLPGTGVRGDLKGAQLGLVWTSAKGDVQGFQGSFLSNVAGGRLSGAQGTFGVNIVAGRTPEATFGTQLAGLGNISGGSRKGLQLSGLWNTNAMHLTGAQLTAGVNVAGGRTRGTQLAGLGNVSADDVQGAQIATLFNGTRALHGAQLSLINSGGDATGAQLGVINVARRMNGFQLGLVNVAGEMEGEALGLLTIARNGYHAFELWSDDLAPLSLGFKFGSPHIYTLAVVGTDPLDGFGTSFGGGLGGHATFLDGKLYLDTDLVARTLELSAARPTNIGDGFTTSLRLTLGGKLGKHFALFGGPAFHAVFPVRAGVEVPDQSFAPGFTLWAPSDASSPFAPIRGHVGFQLGMAVPF